MKQNVWNRNRSLIPTIDYIAAAIADSKQFSYSDKFLIPANTQVEFLKPSNGIAVTFTSNNDVTVYMEMDWIQE